MYARQGNRPGNGYSRANPVRMRSVGPASRISPQGSMRGHRTNDFEYGNYNRGGYGRGGLSKQFHPTMPPPRETDIFMEAGRLAAEYLVSKGVLPPNVFSGNWQHDGFKQHMGNFHGIRTREVENAQIPVDGRASARSSMGNTALDVEPGRRKDSNDYSSVGTKYLFRGKRTGSFKNYGLEVNRGLEKCGSWAERSGVATSTESADNDTRPGHRDEQHASKDGNGGEQNLSTDQKTQEVGNVDHLESETEKHISVEDASAKSSSLNNVEHLPSDVNKEAAKESADANKSNVSPVAVKGGINDNDLDQKNGKNKEVIATAMKDSLVSAGHVDLVKHIKFVNVPTKARSSLTMKASKRDQGSMKEEESVSESELTNVSGVHAMDVDIDNSNGNASSHENYESKCRQSDLTAPVKEEPNVTYTTEQGQRLRTESFPETSVSVGQEPDVRLSGFSSSNSMLTNEGKKRVLDDNTDGREDFKKLKEWVPPMDVQFHGTPPQFGSLENQPTLPESSKSSYATNLSDEYSISLFPGGQAGSCEFMEEKQLFPGPLKTCDLNLVGTSDVNENCDLHVFPTVVETGKEAVPIELDLSTSNNCNLPNKNGKSVFNDYGIEVIDLDYESAPEDKSFSTSQRREDTLSTDLDGFHNNVHNSNEIPGIQDGYGLMMSELLGNDSPNSSLATSLNSLHNHMGLPVGEGILGDDDSIYMSLGEIPINLLGAWEQPTQDYGKPF